MVMTDQTVAGINTETYQQNADEHLLRHFAPVGNSSENPLKVIVKGEGCYLFDSDGNKYLDALSALFCVNLGYSYGEELGEAALAQYKELGYAPIWGTAHPRAIELAEKLAELTPDGFNEVFLVPSGGEGVETAWKIARQYYRLRGEYRWKAIARDMAYHGSTMGTLQILGISDFRTPFEPLGGAGRHVRNARRLGRPASETEAEFTAFLLDDLETRIVSEDPATVAMVIMEPVQNHGGMIVSPEGYYEGVRAICDKYGILFVADETITGFGRVGAWFASERFNMKPDIITCAKGLSSAHAVIGAAIIHDRVRDEFIRSGAPVMHGNTFGGHPVMAAVALKNIEIMERLDLPNYVLSKEQELSNKLATLKDLPIVADLRGIGFYYAIELTSVKQDGTPLSEDQKAYLYGNPMLKDPLEEKGIMLRTSTEGGDPVLSISPPLVADTKEFDLIVDTLREVLTSLVAEHAKY